MDPEDDDTGLTRRQILAGGAASLIAGSCGDGGATDGEQDTEGEDTGTDGGDDSGAVPIPEGMSAVAIVHREAIGDAVRRAIALAGGIDEIQPGQAVFIKPNAVSDRAVGTDGIRTSKTAAKAEGVRGGGRGAGAECGGGGGARG